MNKKNMFFIFLLSLVLFYSCSVNTKHKFPSKEISDLTMPGNKLQFKEIEGYENYKIISTHFRTDKQEIRYILGNKKAYRALKKNKLPLPEGSIVVKIGWKVKKMENFKPALEAGKLQRVEYMIKDIHRFPNNPGNWGYARFVKNKGKYTVWVKGTQSCISCHNLAKQNDFLFSKYQSLH